MVEIRLPSGSYVYLIGKFSEDLHVLSELIKHSETTYILLKPTVALVKRKGFSSVRIALPQLSILSEEPLPFRDPDYVLAEDVWCDVKKVIESQSILFVGNGRLRMLLEPSLPQFKVFEDTSVPAGLRRCVVIDESCNLSLKTYLENFLTEKHLVLLPSLNDVKLRSCRGLLKSLWFSHPILSGLTLPNSEVEFHKLADLNDIRKLKILTKPLITVDDEVFIGELSFNKSIVINGILDERSNINNLVNEVLIRAFIYVC